MRSYDPQIGVWTGADPYDQFASPYVGMGNDPVNGIDPDGGCTWCEVPERALTLSEVVVSNAPITPAINWGLASSLNSSFLNTLAGNALTNPSFWNKNLDVSGAIGINKFEYGKRDNWLSSSLKFAGNVGISVYNGAVGAVDAMVNVQHTAASMYHGVVNGYTYLSTNTAGQLWSDAKGFAAEKLTDPHFYEDALAMAITMRVGGAFGEMGAVEAGGTVDFVEGVVVRSKKLGYVGEGTVHVRPTIDAIESGALKPRNSFGYLNREGHTLLKGKPSGYWQEYHLLEFGGKSPLRILRGNKGEYFLSPDHYESIIPLNLR